MYAMSFSSECTSMYTNNDRIIIIIYTTIISCRLSCLDCVYIIIGSFILCIRIISNSTFFLLHHCHHLVSRQHLTLHSYHNVMSNFCKSIVRHVFCRCVHKRYTNRRTLTHTHGISNDTHTTHRFDPIQNWKLVFEGKNAYQSSKWISILFSINNNLANNYDFPIFELIHFRTC